MTTALQEQNAQSSAVAGRVVRVIGPVVDVEFPREALPALYNALHVEIKLEAVAKTVTLEVAQHLGDNLVRAVSMAPTDGLVRGAAAEHRHHPGRTDRELHILHALGSAQRLVDLLLGRLGEVAVGLDLGAGAGQFVLAAVEEQPHERTWRAAEVVHPRYGFLPAVAPLVEMHRAA